MWGFYVINYFWWIMIWHSCDARCTLFTAEQSRFKLMMKSYTHCSNVCQNSGEWFRPLKCLHGWLNHQFTLGMADLLHVVQICWCGFILDRGLPEDLWCFSASGGQERGCVHSNPRRVSGLGRNGLHDLLCGLAAYFSGRSDLQNWHFLWEYWTWTQHSPACKHRYEQK